MQFRALLFTFHFTDQWRGIIPLNWSHKRVKIQPRMNSPLSAIFLVMITISAKDQKSVVSSLHPTLTSYKFKFHTNHEIDPPSLKPLEKQGNWMFVLPNQQLLHFRLPGMEPNWLKAKHPIQSDRVLFKGREKNK